MKYTLQEKNLGEPQQKPSKLETSNTEKQCKTTDLSRDKYDRELIIRTVGEDKNAFREIVENYTPLFFSLAMKTAVKGDRDKAEEAVQEIFLKIYKALPAFNPEKRFFPWAYTIALNHLRSLGRKELTRSTLQETAYNDELGIRGGGPEYPGPEQQYLKEEGEAMVLQALEQIRGEYRDIFVLRQIQGLTVAETACILDYPEGTVKTYLHRARKEILAWLKENQWPADERD